MLASKSSRKDKSTIFGDDIQIKQPCYARYVKIVGKYNSKNSSFHVNELRVYGNEVTEYANYSLVDNAINKVPKDLSLYTADSLKALQDAIIAIERNLDIRMQSKVDAMAYNLEKALNNLVRIGVSNTQSNENNNQVNTSDNYYPMIFMMVSMISGLSIVLMKKER